MAHKSWNNLHHLEEKARARVTIKMPTLDPETKRILDVDEERRTRVRSSS